MNTKNKKQIFISYAKEDWEIASRLYNDLKNRDLLPWLDSKELLPGQYWKHVIHQSIKNCSYFMALISKNSVSKRGFVQKELKIALDLLDETPISEIYIIPIRIDDSKPIDSKLHDLHWTDFSSSYEDGFEQIMKIFKPEIEKDRKIKYLDSLKSIKDNTSHLWDTMKWLPLNKKTEFDCEIRSSTFQKIHTDLILLSKEGKFFEFNCNFSYTMEEFRNNEIHPYPTGKKEEVLELSITNISNELITLMNEIV